MTLPSSLTDQELLRHCRFIDDPQHAELLKRYEELLQYKHCMDALVDIDENITEDRIREVFEDMDYWQPTIDYALSLRLYPGELKEILYWLCKYCGEQFSTGEYFLDPETVRKKLECK